MRIARPALEQVREFAAERGCIVFDEAGHRFLAPDRSRVIRISEIQSDRIYLWDSAVGIVVLPRERRASGIHKPMDLGDKASGGQFGPLEAQGERA